jgi:hypothetical protein
VVLAAEDFFGNVAANFEKVGNVNVFSSDNCFSLCSCPWPPKVTTYQHHTTQFPPKTNAITADHHDKALGKS